MVEVDGAARPCALSSCRPRPRRPRRLSPGARSSGPRRAHGDARHRADLRHVARHGRQHGDEGLALAVSGAALSAAGNADRQGAGRISRMEDGELGQGEESLRLRPARARTLPRVVLRSAAHPRPMRGLPRRRAGRRRRHQRHRRPQSRQDHCLPAAGAVGRRRHRQRDRRAAWRSGSNGRRRRPASRSTPAISSPRKIPTPRPRLC